MLRKLLLVGACALAASASSAIAQTHIETPGGGTVGTWGKPNTQTFGQTFTTPGDAYLTNFSFWLGEAPKLKFQAYVYAWDSALGRATGSSLFTSAVMPGPSGSGYTRVDISTGSLLLNPGSMYVAFLSTSELIGAGYNSWELSFDAYDGGGFVASNNGEETSLWTAESWFQFPRDLRFAMDFAPQGPGSVTPEPISMALLGTGLAGVAAARRRKRQAQDA